MRSITRALLSLLLVLCLTLSAVGCDGGNVRDDLTVENIRLAITPAVEKDSAWVAVDSDFISASTWGEDYEELLSMTAEYVICIASNADMNINEMGIFRFDSAADAKRAKEIVDGYLTATALRMTPLLESYNQAELPKLDNADVTVLGNYLVYTILDSTATTAVHSAFEEMLTEPTS